MVNGGFKFEVQRCNAEGCEKVAGGRSEAETTGHVDDRSHAEGVPEVLHVFSVRVQLNAYRWSATTGYYL